MASRIQLNCRYVASPRVSDTFAPGKRARVLVPTKNDVVETHKEAIQTLIEPK